MIFSMVRHMTSPTLVGRGDQLNLLLELSRAGSPRCALVSGEAGIGKTALVESWNS
jgi:predicted ATPase